MFCLNQDFVLRKIHGTNLLVPIRRNELSMDVMSLNTTAAMVIDECGNYKDANALSNHICDRFPDEDRCEVFSTIKSYIEELIDTGMIKQEE